ncbi:MAG: ABC transporter ATP-binding protein [Eggerthellaceae bacterium]
MSEPASDYDSVEDLLNEQAHKSIHIECRNATSRKAIEAVRTIYQHRRCAFFLESDNGFGRDTVRSYLVFFSRLAGSSITAAEAMKRFDIAPLSRTPMRKLTREQRALVNFARLFLFEPEVVFCERPLANLEAHARSLVLNWIANETDRGTIFITVGEPLREALLIPAMRGGKRKGASSPPKPMTDLPPILPTMRIPTAK